MCKAPHNFFFDEVQKPPWHFSNLDSLTAGNLDIDKVTQRPSDAYIFNQLKNF